MQISSVAVVDPDILCCQEKSRNLEMLSRSVWSSASESLPSSDGTRVRASSAVSQHSVAAWLSAG